MSGITYWGTKSTTTTHHMADVIDEVVMSKILDLSEESCFMANNVLYLPIAEKFTTNPFSFGIPEEKVFNEYCLYLDSLRKTELGSLMLKIRTKAEFLEVACNGLEVNEEDMIITIHAKYYVSK
jgi:hypothetical protein